MRVLIIDDEASLVDILMRFLSDGGHEVASAVTAADGLNRVRDFSPEVVLLDIYLPDQSGIDLLPQVLAAAPETVILMMTGVATTKSAVQAMKMGAEDYLEKPFDLEELKVTLEKIAEKLGLKREVEFLKGQRREYAKDYLFLTDPSMQKIYQQIEQAAAQDKVTTLILGETGTGKEHVAKLIHWLSPRASKPFVELHCGALPETLLESELFGYEPGAFTDARKQKLGLFETAQGGSLFLDEIGDLPPSIQIKLLKVLEQKTLRRLGSTHEIQLDVRVITATNRDLEKEVKDGRFRADLFYRLNVIPITLPVLHQRPKDIVQLANFFFKESCRVFNKSLGLIPDDVMKQLSAYAWPGNVRELKNVIERMVIWAKGKALTLKDSPREVRNAVPGAAGADRGVVTRAQAEKDAIRRALTHSKGNQSKAAQILGITRKTLFNKMKKFGLK
jgi:two-component system response regulator AtoC